MSDEDQFDDEFDGVDEFDSDADFQGGTSLKELWRKNPIFKFGVIAVGIVVIIISVNIFGAEEERVETSAVATGQAAQVRGKVGEEVTDIYRQALETRNQQDLEAAQEEDTSFVPVPVDPIKTTIAPIAREMDDKEDPMAQWKELQEKRMRRQNEENRRRRMMEIQNQRAMAAMPKQNDKAAEARKQALGRLSQAMMEQMAVIAGRHEHKPMERMAVTSEDSYFEGLLIKRQRQAALAGGMAPAGMGTGFAGGSAFGNNNAFGGSAMSQQPLVEEEPLIVAGDIVYAQMLIEANSDIPSVVLGQIHSGHFEGSRVIGSFSREDEHLVINFNQIVKDGRSYQVSGVAVDPGTSLPALATEVDHRYFKRIFLPAASKFIEGVAEAVTENGNTSIVSSETGETVATETEDLDLNEELLKGVSEASEIVTDILLDEGEDTQILVRVEAGTPMGILFTESVYESNRIGSPTSGGGAGFFGGQPNTGLPMTGVPAAAASSAVPAGVPSPAGFDPAALNLVPNP